LLLSAWSRAPGIKPVAGGCAGHSDANTGAAPDAHASAADGNFRVVIADASGANPRTSDGKRRRRAHGEYLDGAEPAV